MKTRQILSGVVAATFLFASVSAFAASGTARSGSGAAHSVPRAAHSGSVLSGSTAPRASAPTVKPAKKPGKIHSKKSAGSAASAK